MVKKIHYCWFGGKELPKSVKQCIATWKKMLPDYEIKEWNEKNFNINECQFVKEAYENKKWAFVSDYARIYALYQEGGIYFDTDMKVLKDVSNIVDKDMFLGYEDSGYVGTAVIGVKEKENKYIKEILDYYNGLEHFNPEIMYNYANPVIITKTIKKYDSVTNEEGIKIFDNKIYVYPRDYFYPLSYNYAEKVYTKNTCMVHLFNATWTDNGEKRVIGINRKFGPTLGKTINSAIDKIFGFKNTIVQYLKRMYNFARMKYSIYVNRTKRVKRIKEELAQKDKKYIVICNPENIEENIGIKELFDNHIFELREMHTKKEAKLIAKSISELNIENVIFNSYANGWDTIMAELKMLNRKINIKILISGGTVLIAENDNSWNSWNTIIDIYNKGNIDEFVFFKKSLYEFYKKKGYNAKHIMKYAQIKDIEKYKEAKEKKDYIKIGLYEAYDTANQNPYSQLNAVSLIENCKLDCVPLNYKISMTARKYNINLSGTSGNISKEELYKKMANNDLNLYLTLMDTSKMLPLESLELGTVCLVGSNYECFDGSELEKYLVVDKVDNIIEIHDKIKYALENKEKILNIYKEWKEKYIKEAKDSLEKLI